ncbi:MAG: hypothetical protein ACOVMQ_00030 [Cyclobacteriaceae bacterium]
MPVPDKIIIYTAFDNVIAANIAKTKLDAYGIPCFLTEENFTGLYPLKNDLFPGVRLHIFEQDATQVKKIFEEDFSKASDTGEVS